MRNTKLFSSVRLYLRSFHCRWNFIKRTIILDFKLTHRSVELTLDRWEQFIFRETIHHVSSTNLNTSEGKFSLSLSLGGENAIKVKSPRYFQRYTQCESKLADRRQKYRRSISSNNDRSGNAEARGSFAGSGEGRICGSFDALPVNVKIALNDSRDPRSLK